jgi:hypothetical protein
MKSNHIEIQRNNVTVNEFLTYVATMCAKKGMERTFSPEDFTNPATHYHSSYSVIDGKKHCHFSEYRTLTRYRGKLKSYSNNGYQIYYRDNTDLEEYEEREYHHYDQILDADNEPAKSELVKTLPYDLQTYVLNWDGTCFNETCEFTFDDDKRGWGYYYQANIWND